MEKWIETTDTIKVAEALRGGLYVLDNNGVSVFMNFQGELTWTRIKDDKIPTKPGRIFRIEVPKPEAPEGWEILPHGPCEKGMRCFDNNDRRWYDTSLSGEQDRGYWYARKKEEKPKMVRVELTKEGLGWLCFNNATGAPIAHHTAPAVLGPGGYEYEGFDGELFSCPSMFYVNEGGYLTFNATIEDIESDRAVPVLPVAYWYVKNEGK